MVFRSNLYQISEWLTIISDYLTGLPDFNTTINPCKPKALNLDDLPVEILLLIQSQLPPESILSLSLTTKRFWNSLQSINSVDITKPLAISLTTRQRFLTLLERDTPNQLLCRSCTKLYTWNCTPSTSTITTTPSRSPHTCPQELCKAPHEPLLDLCASSRSYPITRDTVRLILRADTHGASYGLPLSTLRHNCTVAACSTTTVSQSPSVHKSTTPKIIQGRLLLHTRSRVILHHPENLNDQLLCLSESVCPHATKYVPDVAVYAVERILEQGGGKCSETVKCSECETDIKVKASTEISTESERNGSSLMVIVVVVDVWRDLGGNESDEVELDAGYDLKFLRGDAQGRRKKEKSRDLDVVFMAGTFDKVGVLDVIGYRYLLENGG